MIPLLASPSSAYSFLYPRVPVHFGDDSPRKDDLTYVLVWKGWGRRTSVYRPATATTSGSIPGRRVRGALVNVGWLSPLVGLTALCLLGRRHPPSPGASKGS
ncbi:MAG: hypothetical protein R3E12_17625 [Candidatus Eisenbacteria bacterium]